MAFFPERKTYKGRLRSLGSSIKVSGTDALQYSVVVVGQDELHDIVASQYFAQLMTLGEEIELTLSNASAASFASIVLGAVLALAGEMSDANEMIVGGAVLFIVGTIYWILSLNGSGHEIYSVKVKGKLYRDNGGVQYEAPPVAISPAPPVDEMAPAETRKFQSVPEDHDADALQEPLLPNVGSEGLGQTVAPAGALHVIEQARNEGDIRKMLNTITKKPAAPAGLNSRIFGVTKLACPECAAEALVEQGTNLICGRCKVWMQLDES